MKWATCTGYMIGASAWGLLPFWIFLILSNGQWTEVWRERTFFLTKEGWDFFKGHESSLVPEADLKLLPTTPWHPETRPVLSEWLAAKQNALDKSRLKAVGNIVIPAQARLALNLMAA